MRLETNVFRSRLTVEEAKKWLADILNERKKISFDPHTTVYSYMVGIDPAKLQDEKFLTSVILTSIVQARMKLMSFSLIKFKGGGGGITAVAVVSDSHIIVNTFPETSSLILDVYACSGSPINVMYEFIRRFKPSNYNFVVFPRIMEEKSVVLIESTRSKSLDAWLKKVGLLPLINTSEEANIIFNLLGFVKAFGSFEKNQVKICVKDKFLLEILKQKLKEIKIPSNLVSNKNKFCLVLKEKHVISFLKFLMKKDLIALLKKSGLALTSSFLAPLLYKELSKATINDRIKINNFSKLSELLSLLNIEFKKKGKHLEIERTKGNLMRIQAVLSLNKIFPLGMFSPLIKTTPVYKMYSKKEPFYTIIETLIQQKQLSESQLLSAIKNKKTKYWINKLIDHGIIERLSKNGEPVLKLKI